MSLPINYYVLYNDDSLDRQPDHYGVIQAESGTPLSEVRKQIHDRAFGPDPDMHLESFEPENLTLDEGSAELMLELVKKCKRSKLNCWDLVESIGRTDIVNKKLIHLVVEVKGQVDVDEYGWNFARAGWKLETNGNWSDFLKYWRGKEYSESQKVLPLAFHDDGNKNLEYRLKELDQSLG